MGGQVTGWIHSIGTRVRSSLVSTAILIDRRGTGMGPETGNGNGTVCIGMELYIVL